MVRKETEEKLSEEGSDGVGDLDTKVLVSGIGPAVVVDVADHRCGDRYGEYIVRVGKETDA